MSILGSQQMVTRFRRPHKSDVTVLQTSCPSHLLAYGKLPPIPYLAKNVPSYFAVAWELLWPTETSPDNTDEHP
jgi:hypothetical protein